MVRGTRVLRLVFFSFLAVNLCDVHHDARLLLFSSARFIQPIRYYSTMASHLFLLPRTHLGMAIRRYPRIAVHHRASGDEGWGCG